MSLRPPSLAEPLGPGSWDLGLYRRQSEALGSWVWPRRVPGGPEKGDRMSVGSRHGHMHMLEPSGY